MHTSFPDENPTLNQRLGCGSMTAFRECGPAKNCHFSASLLQVLGKTPKMCACPSAKAGTHNHRRMLLSRLGPPPIGNDVSRWLWVPAFALGHAHISEAPADRDGMEVF